jgi:hypothetical protein
MQESHFIKSFVLLGKQMKKYSSPLLLSAMKSAWEDNHFFTLKMQIDAMRNIADKFLQPSSLQWLLKHAGNRDNGKWDKTVGIIMAGNLPLVGFHDLLCTLACGCNAYIKLSSKDRWLLPAVYDMLCDIDVYWCNKIAFASINKEESLGSYFCKNAQERFDATVCGLIASGSDDSMAEIKKEFPRIPKLLRGSRFSFAVVTGNESNEQLRGLAEDMFLYCGLGCRSASYLFVPEGYDFKALVKATKKIGFYVKVIPAYNNSYVRTRALLQMEGELSVGNKRETTIGKREIVDGGFFILRHDSSVHPPLAQVNFEYYKSKREITAFEKMYKNQIQKKYTTFGLAQRPEIDDFADRADTVQFILKHLKR